MRERTTANGTTIDEIVEYYWRFLSRHCRYAAHFEQFKKRLNADHKAAEAEAVVFSLLRAEKLNPEIFEDPGAGGPDFCCKRSPGESFLLEVTSLDSTSLSMKSGLPPRLTGKGGGAFGLVTDKLLSEAKNKAPQMGGHNLPAVFAIASDYDFAGILLDRMAAEYLMTSAPRINIPLNGGPSYTTTDLRHAVFCRPGLLNASGEQMISSCRQSISAIFLVTIYSREVRMVGLLHPEAARPFNPRWFPKIPYVRFKHWPLTAKNIATEWIPETEFGDATFEHRRIS